MIIDVHGHYTTAPIQLREWRLRQIDSAGTPFTEQLTITDDDTATVSLSTSTNSIAEAAGTSTLTATLDKVTFEDVTVNLGYTGTAANGTDYTTPTGSITISAGQATGTTTLTATLT